MASQDKHQSEHENYDYYQHRYTCYSLSFFHFIALTGSLGNSRVEVASTVYTVYIAYIQYNLMTNICQVFFLKHLYQGKPREE